MRPPPVRRTRASLGERHLTTRWEFVMIISIGRETRPANQPASQPAPASCPLTRDGWLPFCFAPTGNARRCFPSFLLFVSRDAVAFGRYLDDWKLGNFSLVIFFFFGGRLVLNYLKLVRWTGVEFGNFFKSVLNRLFLDYFARLNGG